MNKRNKDLDCKICRHISQNKFLLSCHLRKMHKINAKDYYDKYLKQNGDGICINCGNITKWISANGWYSDYCGSKCARNDITVKNKIKQTMIDRFGVENPSQSNTIKNLKKQTSLQHYGVDNPAKSQIVLNKIKQTNIMRYGVKCPLQNKKISIKSQTTCLKNYGVKHNSQSDTIKNIKSEKSRLKYGVNNISQSLDIQIKKTKTTFKRKDYILPSGNKISLLGYEPTFLDYVFKNNIFTEEEIVYNPKGILYTDKSEKEHYYFPDFYIPKCNLIVEIKSSWTERLDKNLLLKEEATKKAGFNYLRITNNNLTLINKWIK